ncbi:hemolysin family protein [Candidatus Latescibacterota bacterium]
MIPVLLIVCFLFSFFTLVVFAGAETGIGDLSRDSVQRLVEQKVRGAALALAMIRNKRRFLLMLMAGRILSITVGAASLLWAGVLIAERLHIAQSAILGASVVVSLVMFIAAEGVFARLVSAGGYERLVSRFVYVLYLFHVLFFPFMALLDRLLSRIIKQKEELAAQEEAFIELVKSQSESGVIEEEEGEMIRSIFEFSDTTVREVMVPRIDVVAAEKNISIEKLLDLFREEGHSRIPIYEEQIDHIIGLIYAKDLLSHIAENGKETFSLPQIMRDAYFVPENKKISELLKEFKQAKVHIAVVVDEYGGTAGIVALEDLLEEIVGEIQDEYDTEDKRNYIRVSDHSYIMDAGLDIDDVNDILRSDIPGEDFDTLGGFIYHQLGFIPEGGEVVTWGNCSFTIREIIGNRISKVLVEIHEPDGKPPGNDG